MVSVGLRRLLLSLKLFIHRAFSLIMGGGEVFFIEKMKDVYGKVFWFRKDFLFLMAAKGDGAMVLHRNGRRPGGIALKRKKAGKVLMLCR